MTALPQLPVQQDTTTCDGACGNPAAPAPRSTRKSCTLVDLAAGESARIVRVHIADALCRRRFAELGLAEGMKVTVNATGDTLMLTLAGARMALSGRCATEIQVLRLA